MRPRVSSRIDQIVGAAEDPFGGWKVSGCNDRGWKGGFTGLVEEIFVGRID